MSDDDDPKSRREQLDEIVVEIRRWATPADLRRIVRKLGSPEDVEAWIAAEKDRSAERAGRRRVIRDLIAIVLTTGSLIGALTIVRLFWWDAVSFLMMNPP